MSVVSAPTPSGRATQSWLPRVVQMEPITAPICALALLIHPTPLSWPALVIGALPIVARLLMHRRPWRPTPFDLPLALLTVGGLLGYAVALDSVSSGSRLAGIGSAIITFGWLREHASTPSAAARASRILLLLLAASAILMVHIAQPFLQLDRAPPLGWLAQVMEPWGLYRLLVADPGALQRFRWYASGAGALAAVGLAYTVGLGLVAVDGRRWRQLAGLALAGLLFTGLLIAADNRGSMVAAAVTLGGLVIVWRPKLLLLAALLVFGTLDLIALGMAQRGLNLRTVVERVQFWQNGLTLATETPWTGVGLGTKSVELTYRAAFQPTYPPFSHTHSIYVQALLEQGILGLLGLLLLVWALVRLAVRVRHLPDHQLRGPGFAAAGGALALLTAGLTEIVALTTLGGVLLAAMLGLLAGAIADATPVSESQTRRPAWLPNWLALPIRMRPTRRQLVTAISALALGGVLLAGLTRPILASPFLNLGTNALYRGTLQSGLSRPERSEALSTADHWLKIVNTIHPDSVTAWRNRALAAAALGRPGDARILADTARLKADPADHAALFGVGRAYAEIEAWDQTILAWEQAGAGAQLLRLGLRLTQEPDGLTQEQGLRALRTAAVLGAPGRLAQDAIVKAVMQHGGTPEQAVGQLQPLLIGGAVEYQTRLEIVRVLRLAGRLDEADAALAEAARYGHDAQHDLERGLLLAVRSKDAEAESVLRDAAADLGDASLPLPDGDDPRFWLATVQARQGKHEQAVTTARAGLAGLPPEQNSLKAPLHLVQADSLLALGRAEEAIPVYQAGLRIAPGNQSLTEGLARARQAAGRR